MQTNKFPFLKIDHHQLKIATPKNSIQTHAQRGLKAQKCKMQASESKDRQPSLINLRESKTNNTHRTIAPKTHRYTKSSLEESKDCIAEQHHQTNNQQKSAYKTINRIESKKKYGKLMNSFRQGKNLKLKIQEKITSTNFIDTFSCKSITPSSVKRHFSIKQLRSPVAEKKNVESIERKLDNFSFKQEMRLHRKHENLSVAVPNQAFLTKIKKKRVESNPHLLATIIKRKQETLSKNQLYDYVKKIIQKCAK